MPNVIIAKMIACAAGSGLWPFFYTLRDACVKTIQKTLACLLLALMVPAAAVAQSKLILPESPEDFSKLTKSEGSGPCDRCGVVTNVRSEKRTIRQRKAPAPPPASGITSSVATTPIISTGTAVKDARNANKPITFYKMTIRYDDGTYAFFEQDEQPAVRKGDRIEIIDNRVVRRAE